MRHWAYAVPLVMAAGLGQAQDAPPRISPARDVDVLYLITRAGQQVQERSRWQVASGRQRVDVAGTASYMISDHTAGLVDMVNDQSRQVVEMRLPPGPLTDTGASYARLGEQTIAGIRCIDWQVTGSAPGAPLTVICLSQDGVTLGIRGQDGQVARAVSISYAPADAASFTIPPGYHRAVPTSPPG